MKILIGKFTKKSTKFALKIHETATADIREEQSELVGGRTATGCMELNRDIDSTLDTAPVCVWRSKREVTGYSVATCTASAYLIEVD